MRMHELHHRFHMFFLSVQSFFTMFRVHLKYLHIFVITLMNSIAVLNLHLVYCRVFVIFFPGHQNSVLLLKEAVEPPDLPHVILFLELIFLFVTP